MPLQLITGLPGHGKTAYLISLLLQWEKDGLKRKIYIVGSFDADAQNNENEDIEGILFLKQLKLDIEYIKYADIPRWETDFDQGALIIIDEAQEIFVQRTRGDAPKWITRLSKHRHKGFDFILLTQDPRLLDAWVRRLINEHRHIKRLFGSSFQSIFTWVDKAVDNPRDKKEQQSAVTAIARLPSQVYGVYKSAQTHTIKAKIPKKVLSVFFFIFLFPVVAYFAFTKLDIFTDEKPEEPKTATQKLTQYITAKKEEEIKPEDMSFIDNKFIYSGYLKLTKRGAIDAIYLTLLKDGYKAKITIEDLRSEDDLQFRIPSQNKLILTQYGRSVTLYKQISEPTLKEHKKINLDIPFAE